MFPSGVWAKIGAGEGTSDLLGIVNGRFCALEVKTEIGQCTPEQELFIDMIRALGGTAEVVRSVEDALKVVRSVKKSKVLKLRKLCVVSKVTRAFANKALLLKLVA